MSGCAIPQEKIDQVIEFHGHWCPGLAIGIRAGEYVLDQLGRDGDEDIVAVVETDMCAVDAIQVMTGCTFGKGNLIYRDLGKLAFTFHRHDEGKSMRLVFNQRLMKGDEADNFFELNRKWLSGQATPEEKERLMAMREERSRRIMAAPLEEVFTIKAPSGPPPHKARILTSLQCEECGEGVMESRTRRLEGRTLCISCFEAIEGR